MEAVIEAPAPAATEAPAPQSPEVQVQPQDQSQTPNPAAPEGVQVDRGEKLAEIQSRIEADPSIKLNDEDLAIYEEGLTGKLKPGKPEVKEAKPVEKPAPADEPLAKVLKEVGAKSVEELLPKIKELRAALSGKDAQAVAQLTRERDQFKANFDSTTKLFEDLKAGKKEALGYLRDKLGVQFPKSESQPAKPFSEEDDLLVGGALSRAYEREQSLRSGLEQLEARIDSGEKATKQEALQQRSFNQVVDEALLVADLIPELKSLPNLRNRVMEFQKGKDDPELSVLGDLSEFIVNAHKEKGLSLDLETAYYAIKGKNIAAEIAAAEERGRLSAYNHKPNRSMSSVAAEDPKPETITKSQLEEMGKPGGHVLIPDAWYTNGTLDKAKMPKEAWPHFGMG